MSSKKVDSLGAGMELVRGGIEASGPISTEGCICSPGGWAFGRDDPYGCACGCAGPSSPADNNEANHNAAT